MKFPDPLTVARSTFGVDSFRPLQRESIEAALDGRDSLVILPTGGGKSLCYQLPAVMLGGVTLVVSPLIALMRDQIQALEARGIPCGTINSSKRWDENDAVGKRLVKNQLRLLYVAPERVFDPSLISMLRRVPLNGIVVDEAHCVSTWGMDFRPAYRELLRLRGLFTSVHSAIGKASSPVPVHAFTATATPRVREEIVGLLGLHDPATLIGPLDRSNLFLKVHHLGPAVTQSLDDQIVNWVTKRIYAKRGRGLVYCHTRAATERLAKLLDDRGVCNALPYHAGLADDVRERHQQLFMDRRANVIVATVAFGMGLDVSDVRFVLHHGMPDSLVRYWQEVGRGGRDGQRCDCVMFTGPDDYDHWEERFSNDGVLHHIYEQRMDMLCAMEQYAAHPVNQRWEASQCRRAKLFSYFGEPAPKTRCRACDVCV